LTSLRDRYQNRHGGYTRIWNAGNRKGDNAPIAIIELVDNPFDMKKAFKKFADDAALNNEKPLQPLIR